MYVCNVIYSTYASMKRGAQTSQSVRSVRGEVVSDRVLGMSEGPYVCMYATCVRRSGWGDGDATDYSARVSVLEWVRSEKTQYTRAERVLIAAGTA